MTLTGRIVEEQKNYFLVNTPQGIIQATRSGIFKRDGVRLCTGDVVELDVTNIDTAEGIIKRIRARTSYIPRPPLANLDQVLFVGTFTKPDIVLEVFDRFLFSASAYGFMPCIVFNKSDLITDRDRPAYEKVLSMYRSIGYEIIETSALMGHNIDALTDLCRGRISCFAGISGVGKTALLQRIFPGRELRTAELSRGVDRGRHTTTHTSLIPLGDNGFVADTPGFSFVELPDVPEEEVSSHFIEIAAAAGNCQFNNCVHRDEPGCRIKALVGEGRIAESRYASYVKCFLLIRKKRREYRLSAKKAG